MYVKVHNSLRKVIGLSSEVLRTTEGTTVLSVPAITTTRIDYVKVLSGDPISVAEMTAGEKSAVDAELAATQATLLVKAKEAKVDTLKELFEYTVAKLGTYPISEMVTWDKQLEEALAYTADSGASVPLLDSIMLERDDTIEDLVDSIIENNTKYTVVVGRLVGKRHTMELAINAVTSQIALPTAEEIRSELDAVLAAGLASL